jgi:hypothetical protein
LTIYGDTFAILIKKSKEGEKEVKMFLKSRKERGWDGMGLRVNPGSKVLVRYFCQKVVSMKVMSTQLKCFGWILDFLDMFCVGEQFNSLLAFLISFICILLG